MVIVLVVLHRSCFDVPQYLLIPDCCKAVFDQFRPCSLDQSWNNPVFEICVYLKLYRVFVCVTSGCLEVANSQFCSLSLGAVPGVVPREG